MLSELEDALQGIAKNVHNIRVAPYAQISLGARLGNGTVIWSNAVIGNDVTCGTNCVFGSSCYVGNNSILGSDVHLQHGVFLPNYSKVGNRVFIGPNATCCDDRDPKVNNKDYFAEPPVIEDDASIGAGAVLLSGVRVGEGALVGAGSVVTKDVAPNAVVAGNPAKMIKWRR